MLPETQSIWLKHVQTYTTTSWKPGKDSYGDASTNPIQSAGAMLRAELVWGGTPQYKCKAR